MSELTASELAGLFVRQVRLPSGEWPPSVEGEPAAIWVWEDWICRDDPERGWPVFAEILRLRADDEALYQVGVRLRLLLWRYYDQFIERARELFELAPRLWRIMGDAALDRASYTEDPYDRGILIETYETNQRHATRAYDVDATIKTNPERALPIVTEIVHRAPRYGLAVRDVTNPVQDLLVLHGRAVMDKIEGVARDSVLLRRALWNVVRGWRKLEPEIESRCRAIIGGTTEFTDDLSPWVLPVTRSEDEEQVIDSWLTHAKTFWAWETVVELVARDPDEAWQVTRLLIERCSDPWMLGALSAGPLEDLLRKAPRKFDEIAQAARTSDNVRSAIGGVWLSAEDEVFERFKALCTELNAAQ